MGKSSLGDAKSSLGDAESSLGGVQVAKLEPNAALGQSVLLAFGGVVMAKQTVKLAQVKSNGML